ncbi:glycosyltransferase family 2 protein [Peribacillus butanolivorans]|uniref:glycosyltransferase family 2 protein n=1 Tax=Peribacillus butanolivorans TaxID=421767 RepID=UPI001CBA6DE6|nr:glycosyltransferase family 2 protein [Peribacillus butanolivorans]
MDLQVLVSTMNQDDHSLLKKMNIRSDAIVINQCDRNEVEEFDYNGNRIKFLSFNERGVGLSRNNALMRATADICLFADDDVTYEDDYYKIIINAFKKSPDADMILFNVPSTNPDRQTYVIHKHSRVSWFNCQRYGAVNIAFRTSKLKQENIYFSLLFGGGAIYSAGEDSLFIAECIRKGLKVYTDPSLIGNVSQEESSWFDGYTDKYFFDKGAWISRTFPYSKYVIAVYFTIRFKRLAKLSFLESFRMILEGMKGFQKNISFEKWKDDKYFR